MFSMMKQAMNLKGKMNEMQTRLASKKVDVERNGIKVTLSGDFKTIECTVTQAVLSKDALSVSKDMTDVVQEAVQKAKDTALDELKGVFGGFGDVANLLK